MISCIEYVNERKASLKKQVSEFKSKPCLVVIQVGNDNASNVYVKNKKNVCEELGICFFHMKLQESISENELIAGINLLNMDIDTNGIIVQLPLPSHINEEKVAEAIAKEKDVDGFRNDSKFEPCTPKGIVDWLKYNNISIAGKVICVIGRSKIVGKPLVEMLTEEHATIIWCNSKTKNIRKHMKSADIIISAIGKPNYFDASYFNDDEDQIVIDVGINRDAEGKLCGDVCHDVSNLVKYKTPVPNGVGKLTVLGLIENVVEAYKINGGV